MATESIHILDLHHEGFPTDIDFSTDIWTITAQKSPIPEIMPYILAHMYFSFY